MTREASKRTLHILEVDWHKGVQAHVDGAFRFSFNICGWIFTVILPSFLIFSIVLPSWSSPATQDGLQAVVNLVFVITKVIRDAVVNVVTARGTTLYKSIELLIYADDIGTWEEQREEYMYTAFI